MGAGELELSPRGHGRSARSLEESLTLLLTEKISSILKDVAILSLSLCLIVDRQSR